MDFLNVEASELDGVEFEQCPFYVWLWLSLHYLFDPENAWITVQPFYRRHCTSCLSFCLAQAPNSKMKPE